MAVKASQKLDQNSAAILYEGANMSELEILFKKDFRILKERMHGILPCGKRNGVDIYRVNEVAERMGVMTEAQIDAAMMRLHHDQLPKRLTKEFWAGKRARQDYELKEGDLWPTNMVISKVGDMVQTLNMELNLMVDAVERTTQLTDKQRELVQGLIDGAKRNMLKKLTDKFKAKPPAAVVPDDYDPDLDGPLPTDDDDDL